jgi:low affinity Fe/Cu permease
MKIDQSQLVEEKKKSKVVQIEEETRKEISQMFGMVDKG